MRIVASFKPAAKGAREVTVEDMKLALAEMSRRLPRWSLRDEDGNATWNVTLERTDTIRGNPVVLALAGARQRSTVRC